MPQTPPPHAGLHHLALFVKNLAASAHFYTHLLGMTLYWQPDDDNIYLTSGNDNLALHRAPEGFDSNAHQRLDHLGFFLKNRADVDEWYQFLKSNDVTIVHQPKDHRDGTRSFYCADPDGNVVQLIYYPQALQHVNT